MGEQCGIVGFVEYVDFDVQWMYGMGVMIVDMWFVVDDVFVNGVVFQQVEYVFDFGSWEFVFFFVGEQGYGLVVQFVQMVVVVLFDGDGIGLGDCFVQFCFDGVDQYGVFCWGFLVLGWFVSFGGQFFDCMDYCLEFVVGEQYGIEYLVFGQFVGFGFYYQYGVFGIGYDYVEVGILQLFVGGVEDVVDFWMEIDVGGVDWVGEWNVGDCQGGGGIDYCGDVWIGFFVGGNDGVDDLYFIYEIFGEQWMDWMVDQV